MRATGAQCRWTIDNDALVVGDQLPLFAQQYFGNDVGIEFSHWRNLVFTHTGNTRRFNLLFKIRFQFFDNIQRTDCGGKLFDFCQRQRIGKAQFQVRRRVAKYFLGILISDSRGNNSDFFIVPFNKIQRRFLRKMRPVSAGARLN